MVDSLFLREEEEILKEIKIIFIADNQESLVSFHTRWDFQKHSTLASALPPLEPTVELTHLNMNKFDQMFNVLDNFTSKVWNIKDQVR